MQKVEPKLPALYFRAWGGLIVFAAAAFYLVPGMDYTRHMLYRPGAETPVSLDRAWEAIVAYRTFWAWDGLRFLPNISLASITLIICLSLFIPRLLKGRCRDNPGKSPANIPHGKTAVIALAAIAFFFLFRIPHSINRTFADTVGIIEVFASGGIFETEILTFHWFRAFQMFLKFSGGALDPVESMVIAICVAGGIYVFGITRYAGIVFAGQTEKILGCCALTLSGTIAMFFGYIETTFLMTSLLTCYFYCSSQVLTFGDQPRRRIWLGCSMFFLGSAMLAHMGAALLLPSLFVLLAGEVVCGGNNAYNGKALREILTGIIRPGNIMMSSCLIILPLLIVACLPYYFQGQLGTMTGGGDSIRFVPWKTNPYDPVNQYVHYSMLSWLHAADLLSSLLVAAPLAIPLMISCCLLKMHPGIEWEIHESWLLRFTGTAMAGSLAIPILWNHDFGMWGDWNIAAAYLFPLNLHAWTWYFLTIRKFRDSHGIHIALTIPMILVQAVSGFGLLNQLYRSL